MDLNDWRIKIQRHPEKTHDILEYIYKWGKLDGFNRGCKYGQGLAKLTYYQQTCPDYSYEEMIENESRQRHTKD